MNADHACNECDKVFSTRIGLASHVGRVHRDGKIKPDHVRRLFLAGIALPLRIEDGETLPCQGLSELFFPDPLKRADYARKVAGAIKLCGQCRRRDECLQGAMERREPCGVWGGVDLATIYAPHLRRPARAS